jgi:hypothetical protein
MLPRIFNMLVGAWLIVSAFAWPHAVIEKANTVVCGLLAIGLAVTAIYSRTARYGLRTPCTMRAAMAGTAKASWPRTSGSNVSRINAAVDALA